MGGLAGGFALEYAALLLPRLAYPRLVGFLILGLAIGVFYGLVERGLSFGVLRLPFLAVIAVLAPLAVWLAWREES